MNNKLDILLNPDFFAKVITDTMEVLLDVRDQEHELFISAKFGEQS